MPLTFSHPAIVLPLNYLPKRWISLTGLIAGSVAPDFEYFIRMKVMSVYSHKWGGLLWFDLPVSILLAFIYHDVVKDGFIANLPAALYQRIAPHSAFNWNSYFVKNFFIIICSILIGGASHLFWDSFTHTTGYFVQVFSMTRPVDILGMHIPVYKAIQHISTLAGAIIIGISVYKMPINADLNYHSIWPYWLIVVTVMLAIIILRIVFGLSIHQYWNIIVTAISGVIVGVTITPLLMKRSSYHE